MIKIKQKLLPISCICCIYKNTILKEFILAIDSLMIQEYIPNEVIIIVDGLVNNDIKRFLNFIKDFKNIFKIYYLEKNRGLGLALKFGIPKCNNNLIARFDSDDINLKNRLKIQYEFIEKNKNLSIVGSDVLEFKNNSESLIIKRMKNNINSNLNNFIIRNPLNHPTVLFKKDDILKVGSYEDIKFFEDYELWLRCIKKGLHLYNINQPLVAMKRISFISKRKGFKYAIYELNFLIETLKKKTINRFLIPVYLIRIIIRILPINISILVKFLDSKREEYNNNFDLNDYICDIHNNNHSFFKKFN